MEKIDEGGQAFPCQCGCCGVNGMSKREWYAGMAMRGILASCPDGIDMEKISDECLEAWAKTSFRMSNAMIAESKKGRG